jgi:hypothetical protein
MATYLQGAFSAPAAATVRVTWSAANSDFVIAEGDYWQNHDAIVTAWNAQLDSDFGAGRVRVSITSDTDAHTGTLSVTTTGANFSITWSQTGDGTALRDWLGESADITNQPSGTSFSSYHRGGWYPKYQARAVLRGAVREHRSRTLLASGNAETQHNRSPSDALGGPFQLSLALHNGTGEYEGHQRLTDFVDDIHDEDGAVPVFTVFWGLDGAESSQVLRLAEENFELMPRMVDGSAPLEYWQLDLTCEVAA